MQNRIIITGGGGSGKTTLINELAHQGYTVFPEVSRELIAEQQAANGEVLPWLNMAAFGAACLERMEAQLAACGLGLTFFDRGIPDLYAYFSCNGIAVPNYFERHAKAYASKVFICPPWIDIFENDMQRPESFAYTNCIYEALKQSYQSFGYTLIEVPKTPVRERVAFVLDSLKTDSK